MKICAIGADEEVYEWILQEFMKKTIKVSTCCWMMENPWIIDIYGYRFRNLLTFEKKRYSSVSVCSFTDKYMVLCEKGGKYCPYEADSSYSC